jgi:hypothetical protein
MSNKRKAEKQVADFDTFKQVFVETERVMRENIVKLVQDRLDKETQIDARLAYKIAIKLIRTGTLEDVASLDIHADSVVVDGDESEPQGSGSDL